jgi:hypothetical protein
MVRAAPARWVPAVMAPPVYALVYTWDGSRPVEFDWDEANTAHIARHGVRPEEAEEALTDPRRLVLRIRSQAGRGALGGPGDHGGRPDPLRGLHPAAGQGAGDHRPGRHPRGEAAVPKEG